MPFPPNSGPAPLPAPSMPPAGPSAAAPPSGQFHMELLNRLRVLQPQEREALKAGISPEAAMVLKKVLPEIGALIDAHMPIQPGGPNIQPGGPNFKPAAPPMQPPAGGGGAPPFPPKKPSPFGAPRPQTKLGGI